MKPWMTLVAIAGISFLLAHSSQAQEAPVAAPDPAATAEDSTPQPAQLPTSVAEGTAKAREIADKVDQDARAQEASAGILKQIYLLAERLSFPMFHGVAFSLMVSGVVSSALQLTLGKLFVLARMSFSLTEILADVQGLAISLVGLVLTTQAAAQNSTFTQSPAAVLSATVVGAAIGFLFYRWGQAQELSAADGRKGVTKPVEPVKK